MKTTLLPLILLLAVCCFGDDFRVESRNGVPLILRNGEPVSPRMVYVSKTAQEVATAGPQWSEFTLPFSIARSCDDASLHLRFFSMAFRKEPEKICFSGIEVLDASTGEPVKTYRFDTETVDSAIDFWCTGKWKNGKRQPLPVTFVNRRLPDAPDGSLCIESAGDPAGKLGEFHLILGEIPVQKERDYLVRCRVRADRRQNLTSSLYRQKPVPEPLAYPGSALRRQVKLAHEAGVDFVTFPVDPAWPEPGSEADYTALERICRMILAVNPHARLIPRVDLRVPPGWWREKYPGELMKFTSGGNNGYPAVSSLRYRQDAAEALRGVIRFCESKFGDNMAGYHPTGGNTHEWFYYGSQRRILSGYDRATERAWRRFLRGRYNSDEALREAWKRPDAALDAATVPSPEFRLKKRAGFLLSPLRDRELIDFHSFLQQEMADTVLSLARVVREETRGKRLSLTFYGYLFELSGITNGPACSGHYALRRILESPDIDLVCGPISYLDRQIGGGSTTMTAADSVSLAGKLWVNEDDTSTHTAYLNGNRAPGWKNGAQTEAESLTLLQRNLAVATFHGFGVWWMDLWGTGWFTDPALWRVMRQFEQPDEALSKRSAAVAPAIAEVIDENSLLYLMQGNVGIPLLKQGRAARGRTGAMTGQYLLDDLLAGKLGSKLNIITSAWALTGEQRRKLRLAAEKTPTFWCYAPGCLDLDTGEFSTAAIEETTGFRVKRLPPADFALLPTRAGIEFGLAAGTGAAGTAGTVYSPVPQAGDLILATYGTGEPAAVFRPGGTPALFCGSPLVPPELYRAFAVRAGVHLYTDKPAYVMRRGPYLSICAPEAGEYVIDTGKHTRIVDSFSGEAIGTGPKIRRLFRKGETALLHIGE